MQIQRLMTNLCTRDLAQSKAFYTGLFDFKVNYDSDWFIHLVANGTGLELGLIDQEHDVVPPSVHREAGGAYLTFVVPSADRTYEQAQLLACEIIQAPQDTFYGQRRLLLRAPEGTVCDVSSLIE